MKVQFNLLPAPVQLSLFIAIWVSFMLIVGFVQVSVTPVVLQLPVEQLTAANMMEYPKAVLANNFVQQVLGFGLPVLLFGWLSGGRPLQFAGITGRGRWLSPLFWLLAGVALVFLMGSLGGLVKNLSLGGWADGLQEQREGQISGYLKNSSLAGLGVNLMLMALVPALCEELFFRGAVMKFLLSFRMQPIWAFIATSLFFTVLHSSLYEFLPIFAGSMILCFIGYYTGSIVNTIVVHFLNNAIQLLVQYFSSPDTTAVANDGSQVWLQLVIFVLSSGVMLAVLKYIYRTRQTDEQMWQVQTPYRS